MLKIHASIAGFALSIIKAPPASEAKLLSKTECLTETLENPLIYKAPPTLSTDDVPIFDFPYLKRQYSNLEESFVAEVSSNCIPAQPPALFDVLLKPVVSLGEKIIVSLFAPWAIIVPCTSIL